LDKSIKFNTLFESVTLCGGKILLFWLWLALLVLAKPNARPESFRDGLAKLLVCLICFPAVLVNAWHLFLKNVGEEMLVAFTNSLKKQTQRE
jgi:hypothetical protein